MFARTLVRSVAKKVPARSMGGHGGHGGHSHYDHGLPKWIQALEEAPRAQVIGASIGVSLVLSGLFWSILMARGTCVVGRHVAGAGPLAHHFSCRPSRYFSCDIFYFVAVAGAALSVPVLAHLLRGGPGSLNHFSPARWLLALSLLALSSPSGEHVHTLSDDWKKANKVRGWSLLGAQYQLRQTLTPNLPTLPAIVPLRVRLPSADAPRPLQEYMKFQNMNPIFGISSHK